MVPGIYFFFFDEKSSHFWTNCGGFISLCNGPKLKKKPVTTLFLLSFYGWVRNFWSAYHLHWIADRENIIFKYITCIFFQFWLWFLRGFFCYFWKLQILVIKMFLNNFCCIILLFVWARKECLRFLKSYLKLEILIFLSFVVSFLVDMFH